MGEYSSDEDFKKWELYVKKWERRTTALSIALGVSVGCVVPFLDGHFLHSHFQQGKYLIYLLRAPDIFEWIGRVDLQFLVVLARPQAKKRPPRFKPTMNWTG